MLVSYHSVEIRKDFLLLTFYVKSISTLISRKEKKNRNTQCGKLKHFCHCTRIFREINFRGFRSQTTAISTHLECLDFDSS